MDDLINRQAAIDAIEFGITYVKAINKETGEVKELFRESNDELQKAADRIKQLPSAQPERKKGYWIDRDWHGDAVGYWHEYECSECGFISKGGKWDYCPKCGAMMDGEQE